MNIRKIIRERGGRERESRKKRKRELFLLFLHTLFSFDQLHGLFRKKGKGRGKKGR